ncbi:protein STRUBBELIG-RECEPTOR FAMILY 2 [Coffea eugenioides]|uniref:protein STRUBBELIG-RECEPTOR FAMILY 2 n=1 Tax=Coffea eugenioides TaxID=49369 RepID=UPI000F605418|nr:protein STRUBBELIG-RECEPTOR FAMILY 2 [Coffea eugenioides]
MAKRWMLFCFAGIFFSAILSLNVLARTDDLDVQVLRSMYNALNRPPQLKGWKSEGGDPCDESWEGISCTGSSVIFVNLHGLELTGNLGLELFNLRSLKQLDVSSNNIQGEIPLGLPINLTHLNLANNNFSQNIPVSLSYMRHLRHLNLSHNALSGVLGDVFTDLEKLIEMDLSYNKFSGDLPSSFGSLANLTRLYLQGNEFTGSVVYLADLPLSDLNIEDNHFSGVIPEKFQSINNLWFGGNRFDSGKNYPYAPWKYPFEDFPNEQSITGPPTQESSAIESYPTHKVGGHKRRRLGSSKIGFLVGGGTLVAFCAALALVVRIRRAQNQKLRSIGSSRHSLNSLAFSTSGEFSSTAAEGSPHLSILSSSSGIKSLHLPPIRSKPMKVSRRSFSKTSKVPISAKRYTVAELQLATNSFSEENLLGWGSLGSVYSAKLPDGELLAVKNISTVELSLHEEEQFLNVVRNASRLRHPNIVTLLGYCMEHGQHLLVYEYVRNLSLDDALHCTEYTPLSWDLRLRIALGVARGVNYLHSSCEPPVAHSNLKAANVLLDEDLRPRICDSGLAILRPLSSNSVKLKASEMAIADSGYIATEDVYIGMNNLKADVYAFGVLLLELLTGRPSFDSSKPTEEQFLVQWASRRLHDSDYLAGMVDPAIKTSISPQDLSRFADIVSLCVQPVREFRATMSEVVESLLVFIQKPAPGIGTDTADGEGDPCNRSFRSTNSRFFGSPTLSYYSI